MRDCDQRRKRHRTVTLPDAETRKAMLATGMDQGMEASYQRLENMLQTGELAA